MRWLTTAIFLLSLIGCQQQEETAPEAFTLETLAEMGYPVEYPYPLDEDLRDATPFLSGLEGIDEDAPLDELADAFAIVDALGDYDVAGPSNPTDTYSMVVYPGSAHLLKSARLLIRRSIDHAESGRSEAALADLDAVLDLARLVPRGDPIPELVLVELRKRTFGAAVRLANADASLGPILRDRVAAVPEVEVDRIFVSMQVGFLWLIDELERDGTTETIDGETVEVTAQLAESMRASTLEWIRIGLQERATQERLERHRNAESDPVVRDTLGFLMPIDQPEWVASRFEASRAVALAFLGETDVSDPFGTTIQSDGERFWSVGPDGESETGDDVVASADGILTGDDREAR